MFFLLPSLEDTWPWRYCCVRNTTAGPMFGASPLSCGRWVVVVVVGNDRAQAIASIHTRNPSCIHALQTLVRWGPQQPRSNPQSTPLSLSSPRNSYLFVYSASHTRVTFQRLSSLLPVCVSCDRSAEGWMSCQEMLLDGFATQHLFLDSLHYHASEIIH